VRRTVASCLYDLALLLGEEITNSDLPQVLRALLTDLDEVRIGALQNLAGTLKLFNTAVRDSFLPFLKNFLKALPLPSSDGDRNWRFREELAAQLVQICPLYSPADCLKYIGPPAFALLSDKVAAVRQKALPLVSNSLS